MNLKNHQRKAISESDLLTSSELFLFLTLVSYADTQSFTCFPSIDELVRRTKTSLSTVKRNLKSLVTKNVITKEPHFRKDNSQTTNIYTVQVSGEFWGFTENSKKNKGCHLPSETLYSYTTEAKGRTTPLATSNNKASAPSCQVKKVPKNKPSTRQTAIKHAEIISMEQLKKDFGHDDLLAAAPTRADIIDPLFSALYKVFNNRKDLTPINKHMSKPTQWLISNIKALTIDSFKEIISNIAAGTEKMRNVGAYIMTCIVDHINKLAINLRHEVNADLRAGAGTKAAAEATEPQQIISIDDTGRICLKAAPGRAAGEKTAQTPARSEAPAPSETDYDDILRQKYACFRTTAAAFTA